MRSKSLFFVVFLCCYQFVLCQKKQSVDSLETLLTRQVDTAKIVTYGQLIKCMLDQIQRKHNFISIKLFR